MKPKSIIQFFLILLATSCSKNDKANYSDDSPIIFLHYWSDEINGGIDSMINKFNSLEPGFKIKATGFDHESFKVSMKVMLSGGNPPDLFSYWAGARTFSLVKKGYLSPINNTWKNEKIDEKFPKSIIDACTYENNKYIIPVTQHYVAFFYNKKIFEKFKLKIPTTWNDFIHTCTILKNNGITPIALGSQNKWPAQFWFDYILLRTAGKKYRDDLMNGKIPYTDSLVLNSLKIWKDLIDKKFFISQSDRYEWFDAAKMVAEKKAAMTLMGTWITGYYDTQLSIEQAKDYDYFSFPIINENIANSALGPIDAILLPKKSNISKAEKVLALFADQDVQKAMSIGSGALSPSKDILPHETKPIQIKIHKELRQISDWSFNYDLATPPEVADLGLKLFENFLKNPSKYDKLLEQLESDIKKLPLETWD